MKNLFLTAMFVLLGGSVAFAQLGGPASQGLIDNGQYGGNGQGAFNNQVPYGTNSPYGTQPYIYDPNQPNGLGSPLGQGYGTPGYNPGYGLGQTYGGGQQPYSGGIGGPYGTGSIGSEPNFGMDPYAVSPGMQPGIGMGDSSTLGTGRGYYGTGMEPYPNSGSFGNQSYGRH